MRVTLFDYGAGNLHSLQKAIAAAGHDVAVEPDPVRAGEAEVLVLPGVGAFGEAAVRLRPGLERMRARICRRELGCVGICLGMQLMFERSEEGAGEGLGLFAGEVVRLRARRVPHIGWNEVRGALPGLERTGALTAFFANGFVCRPRDAAAAVAWTEHEGERFVAAVRRERVIGLQFHPEKSGAAGVRLLAACLEEVSR